MLSRVTTAVLFSLLLLTGVSYADSGMEGKSRIMVLPFDGTSSGNFSYLTDSIRSMVSSRLAAKPGVELVDYSVNAEYLRLLNSGKVTLEDGESLFTKFQTDHIVTGALYELQTGLKIQVSIASRSGGPEPIRLSVLAGNEERIFPAIQELIDDIAAEGLGVQAVQVGAQSADTASKGVEGFTTEHPEKLYKKGVYSTAIVVEGDGETVTRSVGIRRSSILPTMLVSMAIVDLDGDGHQEIVSAARTSLEVFRFNDTRFQKIAEHKFSKRYKVNAVHVADLDGDGSDEIYVSANKDSATASAIFSWRDGRLQLEASNIPWYLRVVDWPGKGQILAGQRASRNPVEGFVRPGVFELSVAGDLSSVRHGTPLPLPKNLRLFDFEWVDLGNDGSFEIVAVNQREKLMIYDSQNSLIWVSEENYGGSRNFFGPARSASYSFSKLIADDDQLAAERLMAYIPARILTADVNGDGSKEIIVGQNNRLYGKWLKNSREYDGGSIVCLEWKNNNLKELWKTSKISGYIADYGFLESGTDLDGDRSDKASLYITQVPERMRFGFLMRNESKLLRYDMEFVDGDDPLMAK